MATVQQLIDFLNKIENKDAEICIDDMIYNYEIDLTHVTLWAGGAIELVHKTQEGRDQALKDADVNLITLNLY